MFQARTQDEYPKDEEQQKKRSEENYKITLATHQQKQQREREETVKNHFSSSLFLLIKERFSIIKKWILFSRHVIKNSLTALASSCVFAIDLAHKNLS